MSEQSDDTNVSRRSVLRTGAVASGVALTGAVLSGSAVGSPLKNFGYVEEGSELVVGEEDEPIEVTLTETPRREKVPCNAGVSESESDIKTEVWEVEDSDDELYLIPSGYKEGDTLSVGAVFLECRSSDFEGEIPVTKVE